MKRYLVPIGMALLIAAPTLQAEAQPWFGGRERGRSFRHHDRKGGGPRMMARIAEALDLSDDQRAKMKALHSAERKERIRTSADMRIANMELRELMRKADAPASAVKAKVSEVSKLQGRMLEQRVDFHLKRKALLTDEQREKLEKMRLDTPEKRRRGARGWRRGGGRDAREDEAGS